MNIVMHCGGLPFNGETIKKKALGGSETAAYYLAKELVRQGHRVSLFTNEEGEGTWDGVKYIFAGHQLQQMPLGVNFHFYAMNTPHDVMIIQRQPAAFTFRWASKLNLLWLHDLALHRTHPHIAAAMWNIDGVLTVSEWHKQQVCQVYGLNPDVVLPITNGIDLNLFQGKIAQDSPRLDKNKIKLLYTSRPERGLEHHVRPGGIMEKLGEKYQLYVCCYDNVLPQTEQYYNYLYGRIEELPNCTNLGYLTKKQLADTMRQCDALVYPTEFDEVSCITAMEAMAAGLPFISSECAALPETCEGSGSVLLPLKDGKADEEAFIDHLTMNYLLKRADYEANGWYTDTKGKQLKAAERYDWSKAGERVLNIIDELFKQRAKNPDALAKHLLRVSDIGVLRHLFESKTGWSAGSPVWELNRCYGFYLNGKFKEHYEAYYEYEKQRGVNYGPENLDRNSRFETVAQVISGLPAGSKVLDYGCAHGHYTINLAKRFKDKTFVGIDIAQSNIDIAKKWAVDDQVENVEFRCGAIWYGEGQTYLADFGQPMRVVDERTISYYEPFIKDYDAIIAAEVVEHVAEPKKLIDDLCVYLKPNGVMIITTPYGPWEAQGYIEHDPWRAHLHHLERSDLEELWAHHPNYKVHAVPAGRTKEGDVLGSFITLFNKPRRPSGEIDLARKLSQQHPQQTLAVCLVVRDVEASLQRCLDAVSEIADEIIIAVDEKSKDDTLSIAEKYARGLGPKGDCVFTIKSPLEIGFEEARNLSIARARADWVLWVDADEALHGVENISKYLRQNQFSAYAIRQHHFSVVPPGILRTDLPTRLFRNGIGMKFFGVVHEHPELELNKGVGHAMLLGDVSIAHYGYATEEIRRARFQRNISLLVRDREKYPDRVLGKYLWVRDLAQMCNYELELNGGQVTSVMQERAKIGIQLWEDLLMAGHTRMLTDGMEFYSTLVRISGQGFDWAFKMNGNKLNGTADPNAGAPITARFAKREHVEQLMKALLQEGTKNYDSKYY